MILCSRDRSELLAEALPAVLAAVRPVDEVVVVDSASRDDGVARAAEAAGVRVLRCEQPGLSRARNLGWRSTSRPLLLFTDDDCRPLAGWATAAAAALADPRVGAVWGRVCAAEEGGIPLSVSERDGPSEYDGTGDLSAIGHGACMAFRRTALEAIGGFDDLLGVGAPLGSGEDKDAFWRVVRAGWVTRSAPDVAVTHVAWRDDAAARRVLYRYGVGAGAVAVKRRRIARERSLVLAELWRHGAVPAARRARHGRYAGSIGALARSVGVLDGVRQARRLDLRDGHFEVRR
ncbi:MAG TPA: glycosyltransferase [Mycobacteriales bacterium]